MLVMSIKLAVWCTFQHFRKSKGVETVMNKDADMNKNAFSDCVQNAVYSSLEQVG